MHRIPPQRIRLEKWFRCRVFTASTKDMLYSAKFEIIDQNAEYSIIKKQTQYGISQYDYIVENASTVSEEDIVH